MSTALARLGQRVSAAAVRAGKRRWADWRWCGRGGRIPTPHGNAERCPTCRRWFIAVVRDAWSARVNAIGLRVPAGERLVSQKRCGVCMATALAARQQRSREALGRKRAAARAGRTCGACGAPLHAARSTRKFCNATCRQTAHRHGNGCHHRGGGRPLA